MGIRLVLTMTVSLSLAGLAGAANSGSAGGDVVKHWEFRTPADATGFGELHDLKNMRVADGSLVMEITGPDAYFTVPPVDLPLDGLSVRIRMRCDRPGETQVYWATQDNRFYNGGQCASQFTDSPPRGATTTSAPAGDRGFTTLEFPIGSPKDAGRRLIGLRLDPCNRNLTGKVEIARIELVRTAPRYEVGLAPTACRSTSNGPTTLRAVCRQRGGRYGNDVVEMAILDGNETPMRQVKAPATEEHVQTRAFRFDRPGAHSVRATVNPGTGRPAFDLESTVIIGEGGELPTQPGLRTDRLRLDLIPTAEGGQIGAARWQVADTDGGFRQAGWLLPLAELTIENPDGRVVRRQPRFRVVSQTDDEVRLSAAIEQTGQWVVEVLFRSAIAEGTPYIDVRATLAGPANGRLLDFSGPVVRADRDDPTADPLDRYALFGGLEFLEPGWRSSSDRAVGPKFADRWTPHPFKVCLPVMSVEAGGLTTSVLWHPLEPLDHRPGDAGGHIRLAKLHRRASLPSDEAVGAVDSAVAIGERSHGRASVHYRSAPADQPALCPGRRVRHAGGDDGANVVPHPRRAADGACTPR